MNEIIKIEIPFNETFERQNQNFYFKYVWGKALKNWWKIVLFTLVFLFLGFYPIENFDKNLIHYIFKYGGVFFCGYCFILFNHYFVSRKKFKKETEEIIAELKAKNETSFIILNDHSIEFKNVFNTICSVWEKVFYVRSNDTVIINPINNLSFIIQKSEFKNDEFEIILNYLQKYSKQQN
ncbi:hypothetical protein JET18_00595 [Chryseobacterium sp. L7]|uniref:YcxB-like protein domain-containing protein n=1 Tax=Chryseobacterium endalhagicum TaxID=2797638 RepID=A0ABS1Q9N6_9FLAO|nr:hypothetical protein [Chryseobacterium endalhagicum]MBL1219319.1 hypothetical protein [Chryseobacterium endalhagicum]